MDHNYEIVNHKSELNEEELAENIEEQVEEEVTESDKGDELEDVDDDSTFNTELAVRTTPGGLGGPNNFYSRLINLVRSYPNIYDKFDPGFKSPLEREKSWIEIAKTLNTSVSFAQNRWTRLRERFAREKKALEIMQKSGSVHDRKRLWPYFLPMLFLSSHIKSRRTGGGSSEASPPDPPPDGMTISKFFSSMGDKLNVDDAVSTSSTPKKDVEVIDELHPEYIAWKKRKPPLNESQSQQPRKIMAKPEGALTTVMLTSKGRDGESKILTKLPPGAVLLKNPPGAMGNSPVVLVPANTSGVAVKPNAGIPAAMLLAAPQTTQLNTAKDMPVLNSAEHHFGMLIAKELERFPKEIRAKKKQRILMVLYE